MTLSAAISGGGGLSQIYPSLLILTGSNTYSGQTTISAGTLQIGNGGTTGSIGSTSGVGDSAAPAFDLSTAATFSQTVTGSGGLMQLGPSVLTLTGSNTYTGLTTIASGGTLQIGNGTTGSINSTSSVTDNGLLVFDTSSGTFSKNVSGSGGLTQMASSVLNLGGVNSYSGPTTISAGTLQLGSNTALGNSSAVSVNLGAVLDLDSYSPTFGSLTGSGTVTNTAGSGTSTLTLTPASGSTAAFTGIIQNGSGTVALTLNGNGALLLSDSSTYTGAATITAGTLQIGGGGTTGSINGTSGVTDNGLLAFDLYATTTFTPAISGSGGLSQNGSSLLILAGSETFTGRITIGGGTLAFDLSPGTTTLSNSISGSGGLTQMGPSLLGAHRQRHLQRADHDRQRRHLADRQRQHRVDQQHQQRRRQRTSRLRHLVGHLLEKHQRQRWADAIGLQPAAHVGEHLPRPNHDQRRHHPIGQQHRPGEFVGRVD